MQINQNCQSSSLKRKNIKHFKKQKSFTPENGSEYLDQNRTIIILKKYTV